VGRQIARIARALGMRVVAQQRSTTREDRGFSLPDVGDPDGTLPHRYFGVTELHPVLAESDVVVLALPLTPETRGSFDERALRAMKPGAFLVNVARGGICDEEALVRVLNDGHLSGAALDVFAQEPLPSDHPLWYMPNVLMSPHSSGHTPHYGARAMQMFEENLRRYLAGAPLLNEIDRALLY
jgi:phosphoglycerate dehydrogenase-like enzyme